MLKIILALVVLFIILNIMLYLTTVNANKVINNQSFVSTRTPSVSKHFDIQILEVKSVESVSLLESLIRYKFVLDKTFYNQGKCTHFLYRGGLFKIIDTVGNLITADALNNDHTNYQSTTYMKMAVFLFFK
jgi:hypothetical protein